MPASNSGELEGKEVQYIVDMEQVKESQLSTDQLDKYQIWVNSHSVLS
jgi:hypothetical protein